MGASGGTQNTPDVTPAIKSGKKRGRPKNSKPSGVDQVSGSPLPTREWALRRLRQIAAPQGRGHAHQVAACKAILDALPKPPGVEMPITIVQTLSDQDLIKQAENAGVDVPDAFVIDSKHRSDEHTSQ